MLVWNKCGLFCENKEKSRLPYNYIYDGNLKQQTEVYKIFKHNMDKREDIKNQAKPPCDPLRSAVISTG